MNEEILKIRKDEYTGWTDDDETQLLDGLAGQEI